jgi:hypothetical protein
MILHQISRMKKRKIEETSQVYGDKHPTLLSSGEVEYLGTFLLIYHEFLSLP